MNHLIKQAGLASTVLAGLRGANKVHPGKLIGKLAPGATSAIAENAKLAGKFGLTGAAAYGMYKINKPFDK